MPPKKRREEDPLRLPTAKEQAKELERQEEGWRTFWKSLGRKKRRRRHA